MTVWGVLYTPDFNTQLMSLHMTEGGAMTAVAEFCNRDYDESKEDSIRRREDYHVEIHPLTVHE